MEGETEEEKIIKKTLSASDNMDDIDEIDFDKDRPGVPVHAASDLDHENDPKCRTILNGVLQHSMMQQSHHRH